MKLPRTRYMKTLVFLLFCFFSLSGFCSASQPTKRHLFVQWRHWDGVIVLGELTGRKFKPKILLARPVEELRSADVSKWLGETRHEKVLLYFHAMWGQQGNFHRSTLRSIEQILSNQPNDGIQTVISFIWYAGGLLYPRNWEHAYQKGEPLGGLLELIYAHESKVNVLCHSMGSRLFEGTLHSAIEHHQNNFMLGTVLLFSADLDANVNDRDFLLLCQSAEKVVVFKHRRDRLLDISAWMLGRERLGRSGPQGDLAASYAFNRLLVIDMTDYVRGLHNHTHLDKKWVRQRMEEALSGSVPANVK
jgi:esterase/lipase superfamily enzyme